MRIFCWSLRFKPTDHMCGAIKEKQPKFSENRAPGNRFFLSHGTLDGTTEATTLRRSMRIRLLTLILAALLWAGAGKASVVIGPGDTAKYLAPVAAVNSGDAHELFSIAQEGVNMV